MGIRSWLAGRGYRSAPADVYGPHGGRYLVVPRLDQPKDRTTNPPAQDAVENPFTYGPVYKVALRMGALPIKVYRLKADPNSDRLIRKEASNHPAYRSLRKPNAQITRPYLIAGTVQDMLLHKHACWVKVPRANNERELWPLDPDTIYPITDDNNLFLGVEVKVLGKTVQEFTAEQVCYFRLMPSPWSWASPFSPMYPLSLPATMGFESFDAAEELFETGILERRWIHSDDEMTDVAFNRLQNQLEEARAQRGKMPLIEGPIDIRNMGGGPDDESMMRGSDAAQKLIYDTLGLPADDDDKKFYANAVGPIADSIEQELERSLMSEWPNDPAFPEFQFRDLLKGSPQERAEYHQTLVQSGLETLDEGRSDLDMPPLPDRSGQKAFIPLNLIDVTESTPTPRRADTAGGLGGAEQDGRGILPRVAAAWEQTLYRAAAKNWGPIRSHIVDGQTEALRRRIRPLLKREMKEVKALLEVPPARAEGQRGLPSMEEIMTILETTDRDLARRLREYMARVSAEAWDLARELVELERATVEARIAEVIDARIATAIERFREVRVGALEEIFSQLMDGQFTIGSLSTQITEAYEGTITAQVGDAMARDMVGFAFEQGGMAGWAHAGIDHFSVVFGGGPCTTHVCEEAAAGGPYALGEVVPNVGYSFSEGTAPPLHPSCTCYTVPYLGGSTMGATGGLI